MSFLVILKIGSCILISFCFLFFQQLVFKIAFYKSITCKELKEATDTLW